MAEKVEKERLDVLLVQRGLAPGRDQAQAYICLLYTSDAADE